MGSLAWRRIEKKDLEACFEIQPAALGDEYTGRREAWRSWQRLLDLPAFDGVVVESSNPTRKPSIVGYGGAAFVAAEFIEREYCDPQPYLGGRIIQSLAANQTIVLCRSEMCANNANGGLDQVVLASRWAPHLEPEEARSVQFHLETAFLKLFVGYNFRRLVAEITDADLAQYAQRAGVWRTIKEFRNGDEPAGFAKARSLVMTDLQAAVAMPMSAAASLFGRNPPVLGLRRTDQELLIVTLQGATDREIARALGVTDDAVKRRWAALFNRVEGSSVKLFEKLPTQDGKRGPQKRHRLLAYVREHLEELRPSKFCA